MEVSPYLPNWSQKLERHEVLRHLPHPSQLATVMTTQLRHFLSEVRRVGRQAKAGVNVVAFSGGVDSSVVAAGVYRSFPHNSFAVLGVSASLPAQQLQLARNVAQSIGISLREVHTSEGDQVEYVRNEGKSCYICKQNLYTSLQEVFREASEVERQRMSTPEAILGVDSGIELFNGTNKDDLKDTTRVGLLAAQEFRVHSPLSSFTKDEVRGLARELGLPNHNAAASPCLRSRLAYGVRATSSTLQRVEIAEDAVRDIFKLQIHHDMRVRVLKDGMARVELDLTILQSKDASEAMMEASKRLKTLGFTSITFNEFRSGSVSIPSWLSSVPSHSTSWTP